GLPHLRAVVPRPDAQGTGRGLARLLTDGPREHRPRLRAGAPSPEPLLRGARHHARHHHRRAPGPGGRQRGGDPAAADHADAADVGDHPAHLDLLGRALRRSHHVHPLQHPGRALVGGDHVRRLPDGAAAQGGAGAATFDGYPMARQGKGGQALTAAFTSSFVGAFFSIVLITLFAPILADVALHFGPPEIFAIQLLTFSSFVGLGGGSAAKTVVSIVLGFILAAV